MLAQNVKDVLAQNVNDVMLDITGRPYAYHVLYDITPQGLPAGEPVPAAQGALSTGFAERKFVPAAQKAKNRPAVEVIAGRFLC